MHTCRVDWYHQLPPHVKEILETLQKAGHEAYLVGGSVRDLWLGLIPKDFDLVSSATPDEVEKLFPRTEGVGRQFGIMIVITPSGPVEVARFRADAEYKDGRHPEGIIFSSPEEDAKRRDFTINANFYDPQKGEVIDYVGGLDDLKKKIIRCVGDAELRFQEDALRILRAVRFHAQLGDLGFSLDHELTDAIRRQNKRLSLVSKERITQEITKIFLSPRPSVGIFDLVLLGLWEVIFGVAPPNAAVHVNFDVLRETYLEFSGKEPSISLFFAAANHWIPGLNTEVSFVLTKEAKAALQKVPALISKLEKYAFLERAKKKLLLAEEFILEAIAILHVNAPENTLDFLDTALEDRERWAKNGALSPDPLLTGNDLLALGMRPGPGLRDCLEQIRFAQLNEEICSKDEALKIARSLLPKN